MRSRLLDWKFSGYRLNEGLRCKAYDFTCRAWGRASGCKVNVVGFRFSGAAFGFPFLGCPYHGSGHPPCTLKAQGVHPQPPRPGCC